MVFREIRTSEKITDKTNKRINPDDLWDYFHVCTESKFWVVTDSTFDIDRPIKNYNKAFPIRCNKKPSQPYNVVINKSYDNYEDAEAAANEYNSNL